MNIKTKFNIGDDVYLIRYTHEELETSCSVCNGTGIVHIKENGSEIKCPECAGTGTHLDFNKKFSTEHAVVKGIDVSVKNENPSITYTILFENNATLHLNQEMLFTEKDADKMIKNGNAENHSMSHLDYTERYNPTSITVGSYSDPIPTKLY